MEALFGPEWERTTPQLSAGTSVQIAGLVEDSNKNGRRGFVLYREHIPKNCSIEAYIVHLYAQGTSLSDHVFVERRNLRLNDEVLLEMQVGTVTEKTLQSYSCVLLDHRAHQWYVRFIKYFRAAQSQSTGEISHQIFSDVGGNITKVNESQNPREIVEHLLNLRAKTTEMERSYRDHFKDSSDTWSLKNHKYD